MWPRVAAGERSRRARERPPESGLNVGHQKFTLAVAPQEQLKDKEAARTDASRDQSDVAAVPSLRLTKSRSSSNMNFEGGGEGSTAVAGVASDETVSDKAHGLPVSKSRVSLTSGWSMFSVSSRIHVVWDVNIRQAQEWLAGKRAKFTMPTWSKKKIQGTRSPPDLEFGDRLKLGNAPESTKQEEEENDAVPEKADVPKLPRQLPRPAYLRGERVEYYSTTHLVWLLAEVSDVTVHGMDAFYSVRVHRSVQERHHCELDALRAPPLVGDPCDYWCTETQQWLPASVTSIEAGNSAIRHFGIEILATLKSMRVQASFLRPRFPVGSPVVVFKGLIQGWVLAHVVDGHQALAQQNTASRDPLAARPGKLELARGMLPAQKADGSMLDYGMLVPVEEVGASNETTTDIRNETEGFEIAERSTSAGQPSMGGTGSKQLEFVHSKFVRHRRPGEDWWEDFDDSVSL